MPSEYLRRCLEAIRSCSDKLRVSQLRQIGFDVGPQTTRGVPLVLTAGASHLFQHFDSSTVVHHLIYGFYFLLRTKYSFFVNKSHRSTSNHHRPSSWPRILGSSPLVSKALDDICHLSVHNSDLFRCSATLVFYFILRVKYG